MALKTVDDIILSAVDVPLDDKEFDHAGVKGMKWGVRRALGPDGLIKGSKARKGDKDKKKADDNDTKSEGNSASGSSGGGSSSGGGNKTSGGANKTVSNSNKADANKNKAEGESNDTVAAPKQTKKLSEMSNQELDDAINRLRKAHQLEDLMKESRVREEAKNEAKDGNGYNKKPTGRDELRSLSDKELGKRLDRVTKETQLKAMEDKILQSQGTQMGKKYMKKFAEKALDTGVDYVARRTGQAVGEKLFDMGGKALGKAFKNSSVDVSKIAKEAKNLYNQDSTGKKPKKEKKSNRDVSEMLRDADVFLDAMRSETNKSSTAKTSSISDIIAARKKQRKNSSRF